MVKTRVILNINSSQRTSGTNEDFKINIQNLGLRNIESWAIGSVSIPFTYYTINSTNNYMRVMPVDTNITLTPGNYTMPQLITALKTELDALAIGTFTITYSDITNKMTFSCTNPFGFNFPAEDSLIYKVLGFRNLNYTLFNTLNSVDAVNLSGPNNLYITSQKLWSTNSDLSWVRKNNEYIRAPVIMNFLVTGSPGDVMQYYNNGDQKTYNIKHDMISGIDLQLRNGETYEIIDLNRAPWSIELVFTLKG